MNAAASTATATGPRRTADERRAEILDAARSAFADTGLDGTSTETIAERVGISQPYLFRLFGTKKQLFLAAVEACFADTLETFQRRGRARRPGPAGRQPHRRGLRGADPRPLASCGCRCRPTPPATTPTSWPSSRRASPRSPTFVQEATGFGKDDLAKFMAKGMLLNVMAVDRRARVDGSVGDHAPGGLHGHRVLKSTPPPFSSTKVVSAY